MSATTVARVGAEVLLFPPVEQAAEAVLALGRVVCGDGPAAEEAEWAWAYALFRGSYAAGRATERAANVAEEAGRVPIRLAPAQARALVAELLAAANSLPAGVAR